jgi:hypothetical protein
MDRLVMTVTVALAGDTMLGRGVARTLAAAPPEALVAPEVLAALGQADLVVLNLECCISERGRPWTLLASRSSSAPHRERSSCWPCSDRLRHPGQQPRPGLRRRCGRPAGSRRPLGGGRQPRHGVVSRAEQVVVWSFRIVSQGQATSSTSARGCSSCARSPVDAVLPTCIHFSRPTRPRAGGATPGSDARIVGEEGAAWRSQR